MAQSTTIRGNTCSAETWVPQQPANAPEKTVSGPQNDGVTHPLTSIARKLRQSELFNSVMLRSFRALQRIGINVTPNHFYWPIPDINELEKREWPTSMATMSFDFHFARQLKMLDRMTADYGNEWTAFPDRPVNGSGGYHHNNGFFEMVDAEIAYGFVRQHRPARIIEIGTGFSTRVMAAALQMNKQIDGAGGEIISIDPKPERVPQNGFSNFVTVIPSAVQDVDLNLFQSLGPNDILFIDSSHVVSVGSDVVREYLEIIPSLRSGVLVHIHDIFFPSDYPREAVLQNMCFWSEQYLVQAFLSFNNKFEVLWASSAMQAYYPEALEAAFPRWKTSFKDMPKEAGRWVPSQDDERVWPSSLWIRRV